MRGKQEKIERGREKVREKKVLPDIKQKVA
jgi:hypothetical protein